MDVVIISWGGIILFAILGIAACIGFIHYAIEEKEDRSNFGFGIGILGAICSVIIALVLCFGLHWYLYDTEQGARALKDWQSDVNGGIERTVTVYDINGEVIVEYEGKFDVESDNEKIKFDDEDGKRHIIYFTTGTITIDEN